MPDFNKSSNDLKSSQFELEMQNRALQVQQQKLERALDEYQRQYDKAPVGYLTLDSHGIIRNLNAKAAELLDQESSSLLGQSCLSRFEPAANQALLNQLEMTFATGQPVEGEYRLRTPLHGEAWVRMQSQVHIDPDGEAYCFATLLDITEQKQAIQSLQMSQTRYRLLINSVDALLSIYDHEGICLYMNHQIASLLGGDPVEFIGKSLDDLFPAVAQTFTRRIHTSIESGISREYEDEVRFPGGSRQLFSRVQPIPDAQGVFSAALLVSQDVTERRRAERAMHRSEERLKALINATTDDVVVLLDADFRMEIVNERAARGFNKTVPEVTGRPLGDFMPPAIAKRRREFAQQVIDKGRAVRFEDQRAGHWFDNNMCPVFDDEGKAQAVAIFARDITQRKKMEQALAEAKEIAERANLAKSRFLAAANHDLRQPLQAIRLLIESLSLYQLEPRAQEAVEDMKQAMQFMEGLLSALLDISKLEAGSVVPNKKNFHVVPFFHRLRGQFKATAKEAGKHVHLFVTNAILYTDPNLLARILQNFITNALRHAKGERILVACRYAGDHRRIEVWDDGPGIPSDQLDKIFEEFYQIGNPARNLNQGLGLGLAITKRLADLLELPLAVRSLPDKGSVFSVEIPLGTQSQSDALADPISNESATCPNGLILIVDDDTNVLNATKKLLEALHYEAICATSADSALDLLKQHGSRIRLALLDYRLPGDWDGIQLLQSIRELTNPKLPAVLISGDTSIDHLNDVRSSGLPLLHKPIDPGVLRRYLKDAMRG